MNGTYYITNSHYLEHLCATHYHIEVFNHRRKVNLNRLNKHSLKTNKKCMWKIVKEKNIEKFKVMTGRHFNDKHELYTIWNLNYREPLYAVSQLLKTAGISRRNVYTWHKKPDSNQFYWYLIC